MRLQWLRLPLLLLLRGTMLLRLFLLGILNVKSFVLDLHLLFSELLFTVLQNLLVAVCAVLQSIDLGSELLGGHAILFLLDMVCLSDRECMNSLCDRRSNWDRSAHGSSDAVSLCDWECMSSLSDSGSNRNRCVHGSNKTVSLGDWECMNSLCDSGSNRLRSAHRSSDTVSLSDWESMDSLGDSRLDGREGLCLTVVGVSVVLLLESPLGAQEMLLVLLTHLKDLLPVLLKLVVAILSLMGCLVELSNTHLCNTCLLFELSCAPLSLHCLALGTSCTLVSSIRLTNSFLFDALSLLSEVRHVFLQA